MATPEQIQTLLRDALTERCFSGFQLYAEKKGVPALSFFSGQTSYWEPHRPIAQDTLFDIGSITKVAFTTTVLALAVAQNRINIKMSLGEIDPRFAATPVSQITCEELLSHCAGLIWWYPLHEQKNIQWKDWLIANLKQLQVQKAGVKTVYSDPGFWMLGFFVEKAFPEYSGNWKRLFSEKIAAPLKMNGVAFGPVEKNNCAATEFREGAPVQGEVFDENCAALGGVFTHAGLFGSAAGLAPLARAWLSAAKGQNGFLDAKVAQTFTQKLGRLSDSSWALGWDTKSAKGSTAGDKFSMKSFGCLGFPGCSLWVDPEQEGFVLFFSNRVHPSRHDDRIKEIRPRLHDAISDYWKQGKA